jgi:hypothetical protein
MAKKLKDIDYEFDPVKHAKDGKEAEKVIWSTSVLNNAVKAMNEGLPLKANPFIGKNTKLLKPDLVYKRTEEEIEDYIKCMNDPVYFASKCFIMTPEGLKPCVLRDYQIEYLHHLQNNRFSIFLSCRQSGKSVTTAIYCLWVILFNTDKNGLILSKSGAAGQDLLSKIKDMFLYLPYYLKCGTLKWNQSSISFDNNSSISTEAFSPTAGLGKTINFLILDEFAWCPPNDVELFYNNIIPTVTTISDSNVCIMSTQNGFNLYYKLWKGAIEKKNIYAPFKVDWDRVPQFNTETKKWEKRTQAWKDMMVGILGSEEAFYYQYGTQFSASDKCLVSRECLARLRDKTLLFETRKNFDIHLNYKDKLTWDPNFDLNELKTGWFVILVDLAEGGGGDSTVFNILQYIDEKLIEVGKWKANDIQLEQAALEFWLLVAQLFNNDRCIISIEWNTYGALFYNIISNLNEPDYDTENNYRFNLLKNGLDEVDLSLIAQYKKGNIDDQILGKIKHTSNYIPGIRFSSGNKNTACALLKMEIEKGSILIIDLITIGELENFEDKNGSGTYKASYGHDDVIMTFVQIPMLKQTSKWKDWVEEYELSKTQNNINTKWDQQYYNFPGGDMTESPSLMFMPNGFMSNNISEISEQIYSI